MSKVPIDKNRPSPEWIESLRRRFPIEPEIDRVLTRKLTLRAGGSYSPIGLDALSKSLQALLEAKVEGAFEILDPTWLSGGASKLQMRFKLSWNRPGIGRILTDMVVRMEPAESIVETSRLREFQLLSALDGVLPVPPTFWADPYGDYFPYPAIIYGFVEGVVKPTGAVSNVSGLGINFGSPVRALLAPQFVGHLAKLHLWDWGKKMEGSAFATPSLGTQPTEWQLNWWARVWEEDGNEDVPLLRLALAWLRENMPSTDRLSMIHGDYRAGNFLYTEHESRISAWLDWELAHLGDRHEDLAFASMRVLGHFAEDGKTFLVNGMMPAEAFFEAYEKASGLTVEIKKIKYFHVFYAFRAAVLLLGTGYRAVRGGKTHQDLVLAWIMALGYSIQEELREILEEVA